MPRSALTGTRIRERRTLLGFKQAELAREVEISPSYLNLIEHNRRRIAGKLLSEIARVLQVEVSALTQGAQAELLEQLSQAVGDSSGVDVETDRLDEFVGRFPGWAALVQDQHRRTRELQVRIEGLSDRLSHDPRLSSAMHDILSKVTAIRSAASILFETEDIDEAWQRRFHKNLNGDSLALTESAQGLVAYLDSAENAASSYSSPREEVEQYLEARKFHLAALEPEAGEGGALDIPDAMSAPAKALLQSYAARYAAEAARLPMDQVSACLIENGDPVALANALNLPISVVLRRLAAAPEIPGRDAVGLVLCDGTGTITLRKSTNGFLSPRSGNACPLWPIYEALGAPGRPVTRVLAHSAAAGAQVRAYAMAEPSWPMGSHGPTLSEVTMILIPVYSTGTERVPLPALAVGSACRVCSLTDCVVRQEASLLSGRS